MELKNIETTNVDDTIEQNTKPEITDELRAYASKEPVIDILYVSDDTSRLSSVRGNNILKEVKKQYSSKIKISLSTISEEMFSRMNQDAIRYFNLLWFDNCSNFYTVKNLVKIRNEINDSIDSEWKNQLNNVSLSDADKMKCFNTINNSRKLKCRIIYALDEFVWDAPGGRVKDIQTAQTIEEFINVADTVVVPTPELKVALSHFALLVDTTEVAVIPTTVSTNMYPLLTDFTHQKSMAMLDKPSILIKGLEIPNNVQEFIVENYKKMKITISSIGTLNDHIKGLIDKKKITYIHHWSNPYINSRNMDITYLMERDMKFDFILHTKPDNVTGKMYELCCGDEDSLFSIAEGSIPICGIDHIGYSKQSNDLRFASGYTFGATSTANDIRNIINYMKIPINWDDTYRKCRSLIEFRTSTFTSILNMYYSVMIGTDVINAKKMISNESANVKDQTDEKNEQSNITK